MVPEQRCDATWADIAMGLILGAWGVFGGFGGGLGGLGGGGGGGTS